MARRDWVIGVAAVALALMLHALVPRYEWLHQEERIWMRVDRWSGRAELVIATPNRSLP